MPYRNISNCTKGHKFQKLGWFQVPGVPETAYTTLRWQIWVHTTKQRATFAFSKKANATHRCQYMCRNTGRGPPVVTFAFSRKKQMPFIDDGYFSRNTSRCSREPHLLFQKKQMPLTDERYESRNTTRGPQESHLLFPEKANATHRWQIWLQKH